MLRHQSISGNAKRLPPAKYDMPNLIWQAENCFLSKLSQISDIIKYMHQFFQGKHLLAKKDSRECFSNKVIKNTLANIISNLTYYDLKFMKTIIQQIHIKKSSSKQIRVNYIYIIK